MQTIEELSSELAAVRSELAESQAALAALQTRFDNRRWAVYRLVKKMRLELQQARDGRDQLQRTIGMFATKAERLEAEIAALDGDARFHEGVEAAAQIALNWSSSNWCSIGPAIRALKRPAATGGKGKP